MKIKMTENEQLAEALRAMEEFDNAQAEEWSKTKEELNGLIHPKYFDFAENHDSYRSEGIIEVEEVDYKANGYPNHKCFQIKEGSDKRTFMLCESELETHNEDSEYEGEKLEYLVWQQVGYSEDDYSGYLLLPLLDGIKYWKIWYTC